MAAVSETHKIPSIYGATASSLKEKEPGETTRLLEMSADKKVAVTDTGLCSFWALTWLAAWYIFSGNSAVTRSFFSRFLNGQWPPPFTKTGPNSIN